MELQILKKISGETSYYEELSFLFTSDPGARDPSGLSDDFYDKGPRGH